MPRITTAPSVKTPQKAHTSNDLFDQFWRKGVPFGTLDQNFNSLPQPSKFNDFTQH